MNDLIDRQAAIDAVEKTKSAMASDGEIYVAKINAEMNIQQLPSVSMEKTGRWIEHKSYGISYIECSKCSVWFRRDNLPRNSYCPNCGAKMGVEE